MNIGTSTSNTSRDWRRVSRHEPCQVCGKPDWCGRTSDGELILCMRGGDPPDGYRFILHRVSGGDLYGKVRHPHYTTPAPRHKPKPKPEPPRPDFERLHREAVERVIPGELGDLADELGVSVESLERLGVGVDDTPGGGWLFPEYDDAGNLIGIVRRRGDGSKRCLPGSKRGLTYSPPLKGSQRVIIVEGASDWCAASDAELVAIGRPSNSGGGDFLAKLLAGRDVTIVAENDRKPSGQWPGREGAEAIARKLHRVAKSVKIIFPPDNCKDLRDWLRGNA